MRGLTLVDDTYTRLDDGLSDDIKLKYATELLQSIVDYHVDAVDITTESITHGEGVGDSVHVHVSVGGNEVFSYIRDYPSFAESVTKVFHQYDFTDHRWHPYILFSESYLRASVVNLDTGARCDEPWPKDKKTGKDIPSCGFCPASFRVFDIRELMARYGNQFRNIEFWLDVIGDDMAECVSILSLSGVFALESGCVWGDDSSSKLRFVDLSHVRDSMLSCDDRFGYFELGGNLDAIEYDRGVLSMPRLVNIDMASGRELRGYEL